MVKYIQNYALYESIGSGVYGKVYRAINNNDKKQYAIKVIPISKFRQNKKLQQCTVNQINILTNIQANQHIIKYYDMLKTSNNFYFIYEFCNGGTLEGLLSKQGKLSEQSALLIFRQLLEAFQVLNKYNIMHRDLKPDNIFFHNGIIKLGDFGFCKNLNSADQMAKTMLGSPIYMAPEVLKGEIYSNKADIWSLGVVLYEMLFGHCPFQSNSIAKLIEVVNTKQLEFPGNISTFIKDLIQRMLTKDSAKRIGWMEMFQIKISNEGTIQTDKIKAISSLSDAKFSEEGGMLTTKYSTSTPGLSQTMKSANFQSLQQNSFPTQQQQHLTQSQPYQINQVNQSVSEANFKKNRTSINQNNISVNNNNSMNVNMTLGNNNFISNNISNTQSNANILAQTQPQLQNSLSQTQTNPQQKFTSPQNNENSTSTSNAAINNNNNSRITQQHKIILQGIKLTMQVIQSRIPNFSGYAHLILTKNITLVQHLLQRPFRKQILQILDKELKDLRSQRESITNKMFSYELKGLDDWKKYLRGKFFEDEKTIVIWYRMINFLHNPNSIISGNGLSYTQMAESIKSVLY